MFLSSRKYDPGCSSRIWILIFYPSQIQVSQRHRIPDTEHCKYMVQPRLRSGSAFGITMGNLIRIQLVWKGRIQNPDPHLNQNSGNLVAQNNSGNFRGSFFFYEKRRGMRLNQQSKIKANFLSFLHCWLIGKKTSWKPKSFQFANTFAYNFCWKIVLKSL